ncbi:Uncharacterised protein [Klebsiella michiganensis]|nr:Uncharacterised protein [Klebsiella michiganensis]
MGVYSITNSMNILRLQQKLGSVGVYSNILVCLLLG